MEVIYDNISVIYMVVCYVIYDFSNNFVIYYNFVRKRVVYVDLIVCYITVKY